MKNPLIGIVIVTYNSANTITACLHSIQNAEYLHKNIVVVDNASTDKTKKILHQQFSGIAVIENRENGGFAEGNNMGIRKLLKEGCEYILLLNPDAEIHPKLFENLLKLFQEKSVGIGGSAITYSDKKTVWFGGGFFHEYFCYTRHKKLNKSIDVLDGKVHDTDFITGCCMLIHKRVFEKIGFLDPAFGFYFEDADFCVRASRAGFICKVIEKPLVLHRVSSSAGVEGSNRLTSFKAFYYGRNPFLLIKKYFRRMRVISGILGQFFIRLPFHGVAMLKKRDFRALLEYMRGMREGIILLRKSE
jgi:GT2 family glycosyltransferase